MRLLVRLLYSSLFSHPFVDIAHDVIAQEDEAFADLYGVQFAGSSQLVDPCAGRVQDLCHVLSREQILDLDGAQDLLLCLEDSSQDGDRDFVVVHSRFPFCVIQWTWSFVCHSWTRVRLSERAFFIASIDIVRIIFW